jgi:hypothetical protein
LTDLFEYSVAVEELAAIGLLNPPPQLHPQFLESCFPSLLAFFEQP